MTLIRSSIPTPTRGLNALGRGLAVAGMPAIRPEADRLVRSAERKTGLPDFGGNGFLSGLQALADLIERDASLHFAGRFSVRPIIPDRLTSRLLFNYFVSRRSETSLSALVPPLQAAGPARQSTPDHDPRLQHAGISRRRGSQAIRREAAASCDGVFMVALVRHDRGWLFQAAAAQ